MNAVAQPRLKQEGRCDGLQTEQQLRDAQKMEAIGRLVGGVAHDFNNLLTGMVLSSELILAGLNKKSRLRRFAEEIRSAGQQGGRLVQQLMAVARQRSIEPCLLCINDAISEVCNLLVRLVGENVELISDLANDLGLVKMDPAQVQQIILNLVLNARDAMPDGGRITLTTRNCDAPEGAQKKSWVEFVVTDNGCGMNAETRARLFEPFFTTKKPGKGSGLGLATTHSIVTHEGGTIDVQSEPARGTRITVRLPRVEAPFQARRVPALSQTSPTPNQTISELKTVKAGRGKSV